MKLVLEVAGTETVIGDWFDFETAYDWATEHAEQNDWSEEFNYILTDDSGERWFIECDAWVSETDLNATHSI